MMKIDLADYAKTIIKAIPKDVPSMELMAHKDPHVAFYGEIVGAYIAE